MTNFEAYRAIALVQQAIRTTGTVVMGRSACTAAGASGRPPPAAGGQCSSKKPAGLTPCEMSPPIA
jgi:hypothetical protein